MRERERGRERVCSRSRRHPGQSEMGWVQIERKSFRAILVGDRVGVWISLIELSRRGKFVARFEKEEIEWFLGLPRKVENLEEGRGFVRCFRGKGRTHLVETGSNLTGRYLRVSEMGANKNPRFLVIPVGL